MTEVLEDSGRVSAEVRDAVGRLGLGPGAPDELELLESSWKSRVMRVSWRGPDPRGVVLKHCATATAEIEARIHDEILPRVPVLTPRLLGAWHEGRTSWVAFEDMGDEPPRLEDEEHRAMVSEWLGVLHAAARDLAAARLLPDRGARHYLTHLDIARATLIEREAEAVDEDDRRALGRAIRLCDQLLSRWDAVVRQAASLPPTFVHADMAPENLRIVRTRGRAQVTAIDWEKAGFGPPFADLAIADPRAYASAAGAPIESVSASMWVARLLAALSHRWARKPIAEVERYAARIERALGSIDGL